MEKWDVVEEKREGNLRWINYDLGNGQRGRMLQIISQGTWFDIGVPIGTPAKQGKDAPGGADRL